MKTEQILSSLSKLGLDSPSDFLLASNQYVAFAEAYFKDPDDMDKPLKLEIGQRQIINAMQFGYDIESTPYNYVNKKPPKGVVMIWPRQTGKTTGVCVFCDCALVLEDGIQIGIMAQAEDTAKEVVRRIGAILKNSPFNDKVERYYALEIHMKNGAVVRAHPASEQIRGFSYDYVIVDEAAQIIDKIIRDAALHTARKKGKRWCLLSTPDGPKGILIQYYKQGLATRTLICKNCLTEFIQAHFEAKYDALFVPAGLPPCPSCGYQGEDETDEDGRSWGNTYFYGTGIYTVISVDPFKCSFYPKDEIIAELVRGDWNAKLRQELLGEIISEGEGMFEETWVDAAMKPQRKNVFEFNDNFVYKMGVDFGKVHDNSTIFVGHEEDGVCIVDYFKIIVSKYFGKEYEDIKNEIIDVVKFFKPDTINADATAMGEPILEQMEKDLIKIGWYGKIYCNKKNRLGYIFDVKSKPDLIENLQQYFARHKIELPNRNEPGSDVLRNELTAFTYEMTQSNYIKYGVQTEHDDTVVGLGLLVWAMRFKPWIDPMAVFIEERGKIDEYRNTGFLF